jgi:hypothetical protein
MTWLFLVFGCGSFRAAFGLCSDDVYFPTGIRLFFIYLISGKKTTFLMNATPNLKMNLKLKT